MATVSSRELKENYGTHRITAHKEPVFVTNYGKDDLVLLSVEEYQRLQKLEKRSFHASEMPLDVLQFLDNLSIPEESKSFNHEAGH